MKCVCVCPYIYLYVYLYIPTCPVIKMASRSVFYDLHFFNLIRYMLLLYRSMYIDQLLLKKLYNTYRNVIISTLIDMYIFIFCFY